MRDFDRRPGRVGQWLQDCFATEGELAILHAHRRKDDPEGLMLDADDYRRSNICLHRPVTIG